MATSPSGRRPTKTGTKQRTRASDRGSGQGERIDSVMGMQSPDRLLEMASQKGDYNLYESAMSAFETAEKLDIDPIEARRGILEARIAYAREALINRDFDLAESLVEPVRGQSREAERLYHRIHEKRVAYRISGGRIRWLLPGFAVFLVMSLVTGINIKRYLDKQGKQASLSNMADRLDDALRVNLGTSLQVEFMTIYTDMLEQRGYLEGYKNYAYVMEYMSKGVEQLSLSAGADTRGRQEVYASLAEGIPTFLAFRNELASEENRGARRRNRVLIRRIDNLVELLLVNGDPEKPIPAHILERMKEGDRRYESDGTDSD